MQFEDNGGIHDHPLMFVYLFSLPPPQRRVLTDIVYCLCVKYPETLEGRTAS